MFSRRQNRNFRANWITLALPDDVIRPICTPDESDAFNCHPPPTARRPACDPLSDGRSHTQENVALCLMKKSDSPHCVCRSKMFGTAPPREIAEAWSIERDQV